MIVLICSRFCSLDNITVIKVNSKALRSGQQTSEFFILLFLEDSPFLKSKFIYLFSCLGS